MKKEFKILIILFFIAFILRAIFLFSSPVRIWDETVYANLGHDLTSNFFDYSLSSNKWSDFIPSGGDEVYTWPKMGFRAPLLPYVLSSFYLLNLDFMVPFFIPFMGALSVIFIYILGKELFNSKVGLFSSLLFLFIPLHIAFSARILTDVLFTFFVILTFLSFWKGYEKNNKKYKVFFGLFLALALLSRYTAIWIMPIFPIYLLIRNKSFRFLKDKHLWFAILVFFATLIPWFVYSFFNYNNPFGAFIHGFKASAYWGGLQSWHFFFDYWFKMFSIMGFVFVIALIYIIYKKYYFKKEIYFLLIWFFFFFGMAVYMPHKEDRFILAITPVIALISGYFIDKINKHKKLIFAAIILTALIYLGFHFSWIYNSYYTDTNKCFLEGNKFLRGVNMNSVVFTDESPVVYYYTKLETRFYPVPLTYENINNNLRDMDFGKDIYVLFGNYVKKPNQEDKKIMADLNDNFHKVFSCVEGDAFSFVYKYAGK